MPTQELSTVTDRVLSHKTYAKGELDAAFSAYRYAAVTHGKSSKLAIELRNRIVARHTKLAARMARRYHVQAHFDRDDMMAYAVIGLIHAVETYEPGVSAFATHAWRYMLHETNRACLELGKSVRVPRQTHEANKRGECTAETSAAIEATGRVGSLNLPTSRDHRDQLRQDVICTSDAVDVQGVREADGMYRAATYALMAVSERHRTVLIARSHDKTFQQVGDLIGCTKQRAQQMEQEALVSVRKALRVAA